LSDEAVLDGAHGGGGAVGDLEFGVDVLDVIAGGLRGNGELLGDALVG
jgi:hypothetical protein